MSATTVERLTGFEQRARQQAGADYLALVVAVADGVEPTADDLDTIERAGKSAADLERDADLLRRRRALAAEVEDGPPAAAERPAVEAELSAVEAEFASARQRYAEARAGLADRLRELGYRVERAAAARRTLVQTCADPGRLAALRSVQDRRWAIEAEAQDLSRQADALSEQARAAAATETRDGARKAARLERDLGQMRERAAGLAKQAAGLLVDEAKVEQALLEP